jgi:hypothetical protein
MSRKPRCPVTCRYPPTQTWRTFLRNQAFAIGTTGLGEAGRLSDALLALVRSRIARVVGCVTKVRDGIPCRLIEPSHRLPPYRSSYCTDRRAVHRRCVPIPPWPTTLGAGNWGMVARRLSPYRSRASPRRKLTACTDFARPSLSRTRAKRSGYCTSAMNNPLKNPRSSMPLPHLPTFLRVGHGEQGYKERQDNVLRMHSSNHQRTGVRSRRLLVLYCPLTIETASIDFDIRERRVARINSTLLLTSTLVWNTPYS